MFVKLWFVRVVGVLAHHTVDDVRVGPDQDTEPIGPDTIQDDLRCLGRAGRRVGDEAPGTLDVRAFDVSIGIFLRVAAHRGEPGADLRNLRGVQPIRIGVCLHLERIVANARVDMSRMTTDTLIWGAFIRKSAISASVKPFTANLAAE